MTTLLLVLLVWLGVCAVLALGWVACAIVADNRRAAIRHEIGADQFTRERRTRLAAQQKGWHP